MCAENGNELKEFQQIEVSLDQYDDYDDIVPKAHNEYYKSLQALQTNLLFPAFAEKLNSCPTYKIILEELASGLQPFEHSDTVAVIDCIMLMENIRPLILQLLSELLEEREYSSIDADNAVNPPRQSNDSSGKKTPDSLPTKSNPKIISSRIALVAAFFKLITLLDPVVQDPTSSSQSTISPTAIIANDPNSSKLTDCDPESFAEYSEEDFMQYYRVYIGDKDDAVDPLRSRLFSFLEAVAELFSALGDI